MTSQTPNNPQFSQASRQTAPAMDAQLRAITAACGNVQDVVDAFGGPLVYETALAKTASFPALTQSPLSTTRDLPHNAHEKFRACVTNWRGRERPGLAQLAHTLLADKAIDSTNIESNTDLAPQEKAIARAVMLLAARAEINRQARGNDYHSPIHTAHVATAAGYLGELNDQLVEGYGRFVEYTIREKLLILAAAFAHDIDHPGKPNPADNKTQNEEAALAATLPILKAAGVSAYDCARFETMILTTSPNGPHKVMKAIAHAHCHRQVVKPEQFTAHNDIATKLCADRELTQMAAILSDSDIFASVLNLKSAEITGRRLGQECKKAGLTADFTSAQSRAQFINHVVGRDGYASQAARAGFLRHFQSFVAANDDLLKKNGP